MVKLLLLSHGDLAREMMKTAGLILGEFQGVQTISLPYGNDLTQYKEEIAKVAQTADDGLLILTDLFGGSPFMISSQVYAEYADKIGMDIIAGMNLAMVIQVVSAMQDSSLEELRETAISAGNEGIVTLRDKMSEK